MFLYIIWKHYKVNIIQGQNEVATQFSFCSNPDDDLIQWDSNQLGFEDKKLRIGQALNVILAHNTFSSGIPALKTLLGKNSLSIVLLHSLSDNTAQE